MRNDIKDFLCETLLNHQSKDKSRCEAILSRVKTLPRSFLYMVISIFRWKEKDEKQIQKELKVYFVNLHIV